MPHLELSISCTKHRGLPIGECVSYPAFTDTDQEVACGIGQEHFLSNPAVNKHYDVRTNLVPYCKTITVKAYSISFTTSHTLVSSMLFIREKKQTHNLRTYFLEIMPWNHSGTTPFLMTQSSWNSVNQEWASCLP